MPEQLRVGLIATGSAGQQHAIVLANLPGVTVVAGADPRNGRELFDSSLGDPFHIAGSRWYPDEAEMLTKEQIDALVVAADPLAVGSTIKSSALSAFPARPTLWERPVGFRPEHVLPLREIQRGAPFSVVTFSRFGAPTVLKSRLQAGDLSLGDLVSFNAFLSLSIPPYERKPWRWDQLSCQLPIHLLDHVFDLLAYLNLPAIETVQADVKTEFLQGRSIDRSWSISLKLTNGAVGTINAVQYPFNKEHLMPLHHLSLIGSEGAIDLRPEAARFISNDGAEYTFAFPGDDPEVDHLRPAQQALVRYLIEREGYLDTPATQAGAWSLTLCDWHWVRHSSASDKEHVSAEPLGTIDDSAECLRVGNAIVASAKRGASMRVV